MRLYLMRHAPALEGDSMDPALPLTDHGAHDCDVMRQFRKDIGVKWDVVFSSDFSRAMLTADRVRNKKAQWIKLPELRPDATAEEAFAAMYRAYPITNDTEVLVVTHSPLIQQMAGAAWLGLSPDCNHFAHASMLRIDTHRLPPDKHPFHWLVRPSLFESLHAGEFREATQRIAENLARASKARIVDPLIERLRAAVSGRFARQARLIKYGKNTRRYHDGVFARVFNATTERAYRSGADFTALELAVLKEARYTTRRQPSGYLMLPSVVENDINDTTADRIANIGVQGLADGLSAAAIAGLIAAQFADWRGQRSETIALDQISRAFHDGGADLAAIVSEEEPGSYVTKTWSTEDDPCPECEANEAEGPLSEDEQFPSGDAYPPAHPNCRCSIEYSRATT